MTGIVGPKFVWFYFHALKLKEKVVFLTNLKKVMTFSETQNEQVHIFFSFSFFTILIFFLDIQMRLKTIIVPPLPHCQMDCY